MLLLVSLARADTSSASFAEDAGDWDGGAVAGGVLVLADTSAVLSTGEMTSFELTARVRLLDGERLTVSAGGVSFTADYTEGGGISVGEDALPFTAEELTWEAGEAAIASLGDPDLLRTDDGWFLYGDDGEGVVVGTSADSGETWSFAEEPALSAGAGASVVELDGAFVMFYACETSICRATSSDGTTFGDGAEVLAPGADFDASGLGSPSVAVDDDGTWWMWYAVPETGATGLAVSDDGEAWTRSAELASSAERLAMLDGAWTEFGWEGVYSLGDSLAWATGGDDAAFSDSSADIAPILSTAPWVASEMDAASVALDGTTWLLAVAGDGGTGLAHSLPCPGAWGSLSMTWDGATLSASWNGGPARTADLASASDITIAATGTGQVDEASVTWAASARDTGSAVGDTADTARTGDTGETGETGAVADSGGPSDSGDSGFAGYTASQLTGEKGGCSATGRAPGWMQALTVVLAVMGRRVRR
jgi:hypothetical protein